MNQTLNPDKCVDATVQRSAPGVENMVEPRAVAFSRSLDMRDGHPGGWTIRNQQAVTTMLIEKNLSEAGAACQSGVAVCDRIGSTMGRSEQLGEESQVGPWTNSRTALDSVR